MLPFLKDRHEASMSGPMEHVKREPDGEAPFEMLDAIVEDMLEAIHKKDKKLLKSTLEALLEHVQELDEVQDSEEMK